MAALGYYLAECGEAEEALALVDGARQVLPADSPNSAKAWLCSLEAVAHASGQDRRATLTALDAAEDYVPAQRGTGPPAWPWVFVFDYANVGVYRGSCAAHLGDAKDGEHALAMAGPTVRSPKQRARLVVNLAQASAQQREVGQACRLASEALAIADDLGSRRIVRLAAQVRQSLGVQRSAETADLDARLAALYLD